MGKGIEYGKSHSSRLARFHLKRQKMSPSNLQQLVRIPNMINGKHPVFMEIHPILKLINYSESLNERNYERDDAWIFLGRVNINIIVV